MSWRRTAVLAKTKKPRCPVSATEPNPRLKFLDGFAVNVMNRTRFLGEMDTVIGPLLRVPSVLLPKRRTPYKEANLIQQKCFVVAMDWLE